MFINQGLDLVNLDNPTTRFSLHMFSVMAEHERNVISHRTKEALRVLRERGRKLGRTKGDILPSKLDDHRGKIVEWIGLGLSLGDMAARLRCNPNTISVYCRKRGILRRKWVRRNFM